MGIRFERPLALALAGSLVVHLLLVTAWVRRYEPGRPAPTDSAVVIAVALQPSGNAAPDEPPSSRPAKPSLQDDSHTAWRERPDAAITSLPVKTAGASAAITADTPATVGVEDAPVNLNPVPLLDEDYRIRPATLALQAPMAGEQRDSLQAAVNHFATTLPEWTTPGEPLRWQDGEREWRVEVAHREPATATGLERLELDIHTEWQGLSLSARLPVKRLAFSHFAQVVDRWNPGVSLAGDRVVGRFHSNTGVWVEADRGSGPLVTGPATVAGRVNMRGSARRSQVFAGGVETGAARLSLPSRPFPREALIAGTQKNIHAIGADAKLEFLGKDGYRWKTLDGRMEAATVKPTAFPWLIIAGEGVILQVAGSVSGSILVYSPQDITVTGSLTYLHDPRDYENSPDFLGLVSERNVEVAPPVVTGPGDVDLFASIFAGNQFRVRRYRATDGGRLSIYGSLTAGSLTATEPRFTTRLEFDPRLEDQRPAWFPLTGRYLIDGPVPDWTVNVATARRR